MASKHETYYCKYKNQNFQIIVFLSRNWDQAYHDELTNKIMFIQIE